jgi:hypothetical protein
MSLDPGWLMTGIPRGGTTLAAALADGLADAVCLNEPVWQQAWAQQHRAQGAAAFAQWLRQDMAQLRARLLAGQPVPDLRHADGTPTTNYFPREDEPPVAPVGLVRPGLTSDFMLAVKHNGLYLGALPQLVQEGFRVLAILREPVAVLASWQRTPVPVSRGQLPAASFWWPQLAGLTSAPLPLLEKQVRLLDLLYGRLRACEAGLVLVRYEELCADPSLLARRLGRPFCAPGNPLAARPPQGDPGQLAAIRRMVRELAVEARYFYPAG